MIYIGIDLGKSGALAMIESSPSPPAGNGNGIPCQAPSHY